MIPQAIRTHVAQTNVEAYLRQAFTSMGVEAANIKSIHYSPMGFLPNRSRYCIVLHTAVRLSQATVNGWHGLSGASVNGAVWHVNVGDRRE